MMGNLGGCRTRISNEQRSAIIEAFLEDELEGTKLALSHGLTAAYAWKLVHARGLMPRRKKRWGKLQETMGQEASP